MFVIFIYFSFYVAYPLHKPLEHGNLGHTLCFLSLVALVLCQDPLDLHDHCVQIRDRHPHVDILIIDCHAPTTGPEVHELHICHVWHGNIDKVGGNLLLLDELTIAIKALTEDVELEPVEVEFTHLGSILSIPLELDALVERAEKGSLAQGDLLTLIEMRDLDENDAFLLSLTGGDEEAVPGALVADDVGLEWGLELCILYLDLRQVHGELPLELLCHLLVDHGVKGGIQKEGMIKRPLVLGEDLLNYDLDLVLDVVEDIWRKVRIDDHDDVGVSVLEGSPSSLLDTVHLSQVHVCIAALEQDHKVPVELVADVLVGHELLADEVIQVEDDVLVLGYVKSFREGLGNSGPARILVIDTTLQLGHHIELVCPPVSPGLDRLIDSLIDERVPVRRCPVIHVVRTVVACWRLFVGCCFKQ